VQLYDLEADLGEKNNVAAEHPEQVAEFREFFHTARTDPPDWPIRTQSSSRGK
jgi:hypothetical protein